MPIRPENLHRYPRGWNEISARIRFERAGGRCECTGQCGLAHPGGRCPAIHEQIHPDTGSVVGLTTAHLNHIPETVRDENLLAACQLCHLRIDHGHHRITRSITLAARAAAGQLGFLADADLERIEPPAPPRPAQGRAPLRAAPPQPRSTNSLSPNLKRMKMLFLVRHAESIENATKYTGFYENPRPWTGPAAHVLSRDVVGLTPRGFLQCLWLRRTLRDLTGPDPAIRTSQYRRAIDTAALALPGLPYEVTALLNEQHYGAATYMTKQELYATYPEGTEDRQTRKHLWTPPGADGESLACGVLQRATAFVGALHTEPAADVVAFTHHTAILALRAVLERRPVTELVDEARVHKTPNAVVLVYEQASGLFHARGTAQPDC